MGKLTISSDLLKEILKKVDASTKEEIMGKMRQSHLDAALDAIKGWLDQFSYGDGVDAILSQTIARLIQSVYEEMAKLALSSAGNGEEFEYSGDLAAKIIFKELKEISECISKATLDAQHILNA